jgi:hypothetical protein
MNMQTVNVVKWERRVHKTGNKFATNQTHAMLNSIVDTYVVDININLINDDFWIHEFLYLSGIMIINGVFE